MSADVLRQAAELLQQRVNGATHGPWQVGAEADDPTSLTYIYSAETLTRYPDADPTVAHVNQGEQVEGMPRGYGINDNAEHIAALSPYVMDHVVAWLLSHADVHDAYACEEDEPCPAVAFARVYLGESA